MVCFCLKQQHIQTKKPKKDFPSVRDLAEQLDKDRGVGAEPTAQEEDYITAYDRLL